MTVLASNSFCFSRADFIAFLTVALIVLLTASSSRA